MMKLLLGLAFFLNLQIVFGQTVSLPDTNLRNTLLKRYPLVMQGNELNLTKAAALKGVLDLTNAAISNATGIQYFTGITTLNLKNNFLTEIPSISTLSGLVNFYASDNKLTYLPDMSALTQLQDFQVMNNQLTALPNLSGITGLKLLYCTGNKITTFPSLTQFPELIYLVIGDNPIKNSMDFSPCVNLLQLHVHKTGIDTIIGLEKLKKLTTLYAWGNAIRNISALDSISTLTTCFVYDNYIDKLPYLGNKPNLNTLIVENCLLTFEDILPVLQQSPPAIFSYESQRPVQLKDVTARSENVFSLGYPVSSPLQGNIYVWLKNEIVIDSSAAHQYTFNPLLFSDSGNYVLKIYNTSVPSLVLKSNTFYLTVKPCIELTIPNINITSKECGKGYTIDLSNVQITGGTAPFKYILTNGVYNEKFHKVVIDNLPEGKYNLTLTDSKNCTANHNFVLSHLEKCDPVMTPNGDGIADSYFIEKAGNTKIYDLKRRLIRTLDAPVVWDGTDQNGTLLDSGYYIIAVADEKPVYITIIR